MTNSDTHTGPSFSVLNRIGRLGWQVANLFLFRYSPRPFHRWRIFLLRIFGAKIGHGVHVYPGAVIWAPWNLTLGDEAGVASGAIIYCQGEISIGRRAVVSQGAHLCAGTHDYNHPGFPLITKPIKIGDYAWIASEAFVHGGVSIGDGCVVGARAVVTKDMPEWMVCAGHPCKSIKPRERGNVVAGK